MLCDGVVEQLTDVSLIYLAALALAIGPVVAAEGNALVELDAQPLESFNDVGLGLGHEARSVGVLNAEHQVAAMLACKQVVIQGSAHTTNVQWPRGAGCKAHPYSSFTHVWSKIGYIVCYFAYKGTNIILLIGIFAVKCA